MSKPEREGLEGIVEVRAKVGGRRRGYDDGWVEMRLSHGVDRELFDDGEVTIHF